ncbi:hypothetical protein QR680_001033 [Steinernema hermaphroditum]|uniref:Uncharacterized protein n=1 Tax=Steinernema hermaphroditum TaxID=289476 RepID=A0AA39GWR5_9BILA|nr:hypothetical protein QR680_001033 [Steinernema hermaphroditum]
MKLLSLACLFGFVATSLATIGLDSTDSISVSGFNCLHNDGYRFFLGRAWRSNGEYDYTGIQNIKNARAAGWIYVDAYIFPCLASHCAAPGNQVLATIDKLRAEGAQFGMLWLDIEVFDWPANHEHNRQVVREMVQAGESRGVKLGIYTNYNNWQSIVGATWSEFSRLPLWWARYNGHQNYDGFSSFGGWSKPAIHQYSGDVQGGCGIDMDQNWY